MHELPWNMETRKLPADRRISAATKPFVFKCARSGNKISISIPGTHRGPDNQDADVPAQERWMNTGLRTKLVRASWDCIWDAIDDAAFDAFVALLEPHLTAPSASALEQLTTLRRNVHSHPDETIAEASRLLALDPAWTEILFVRGQARERLKDTDGALVDYDAALDLYPDHVGALLRMGYLRINDKPEEALGFFARADVVAPEDDSTRYHYTRQLQRVGRTAAAIAELDRGPLFMSEKEHARFRAEWLQELSSKGENYEKTRPIDRMADLPRRDDQQVVLEGTYEKRLSQRKMNEPATHFFGFVDLRLEGGVVGITLDQREAVEVEALSGKRVRASGILRLGPKDTSGADVAQTEPGVTLLPPVILELLEVEVQSDSPNAAMKPSVFMAAIAEGRSDEVLAGLASGADPNAFVKGFGRPISAAAKAGHVAVIGPLLSAGAEDGDHAIFVAARKDQAEAVGALLAGGVSPDGEGAKRVPLVSACMEGAFEAAKALLEGGADPNRRSARDPSALFYAVGRPGDRADITQMLVDAGAELDPTDTISGNTPLTWALFTGNQAMAEVLIKAGADVKVRDKGRASALHMAALRGMSDVVKHLIAAGVGVDLVDGDRATALQQGATGGFTEVVSLLLAAGADKTIKNKGGYDALALATLHQHAEVVSLLSETPSSLTAAPGADRLMYTGPMSRHYPCSDHRLLFMIQNVGYLLTQFPDLVAASRIEHAAIKAIGDAACQLNSSLNTYSPGGKAVYANPAEEEAVVNQLNELWKLIDQVRKASEVLTAGAPARFAQIWCELERPGEHVLESSDMSEASNVQYVVFADIRHQIPDKDFRADLARLSQLPELRLAALYYNDLRDGEVAGLRIADLTKLRGLNLSSNKLTQIPFASESLELLDLASNPITRPPDLSRLPSLKWLGLAKTGLAPALVDTLREAHPAITIWN